MTLPNPGLGLTSAAVARKCAEINAAVTNLGDDSRRFIVRRRGSRHRARNKSRECVGESNVTDCRRYCAFPSRPRGRAAIPVGGNSAERRATYFAPPGKMPRGRVEYFIGDAGARAIKGSAPGLRGCLLGWDARFCRAAGGVDPVAVFRVFAAGICGRGRSGG